MAPSDTIRSSASRRRFLTAAGAAGAIGLAGCLGGDDDGGDGDGGDGGGGGGTTVEELTEITMTNFPINNPGAIWEYLDGGTNIFANEMESAGYSVSREASFEGPSLFYAEQADIATDLNTIEAARGSVNRDMDLAVLDRSQSTFLGLMTRAGSKWDPAESGGVAESLRLLLGDQGRIGIFGWGVGDVPAYQVAVSRVTDGLMQQDGGDFDVVTADPAAIPKLIDQGDLDAGASSPTHGAGGLMFEEELAPLMYPSDYFARQGWGEPSLENAVVRQDFLEEHRPACEAVVRAWDQGTTWFYENGVDEIPGNDSYMEKLGTTDPEVAEYAVRWVLGEDVLWQYETDTPKLYNDVYLNQDYVDRNMQFLNTAEEINQVPSGWEERVSFAMDIQG